MPSTKHRYVQWVFDRALFATNAHAGVVMILNKVKTDRQLPPIFVEALRGGPFSGTILKMLSRKEIPVAVLAQAVGQTNPFPCAHCEQMLRNSDTEERRGMLPFFGCVSYTPYHRACGNCLMVGRNTQCDWQVHFPAVCELQDKSKVALGLSIDDSRDGIVFNGQELVNIAEQNFSIGASWR
jgi:hypothetical protein